MKKLAAGLFMSILVNFALFAQDRLPEHKLTPSLLDKTARDWVYEAPGKLKIALCLKNASNEDFKAFNEIGFRILDSVGSILIGAIDTSRILKLAEHPSIHWIDAVAPEPGPLNDKVRSGQRINYLQSGVAYPGLFGNGVVIGVGDGGELGSHIDFGERVLNLANGSYSNFGQHQDHVSGTIGGAGNLQPAYRGIAAEADIITQKTTLINYNIPNYYAEYGMVLTNNSYGSSLDCASSGLYTYQSNLHDQFMLDDPEVLIVFAAGNSGQTSCTGYPQGYKTILKHYQSAKNVLTVGNIGKNRIIANNSSRGPVADGRIKPEILGVGSNPKVWSTGNNFNYFQGGGTSMSAAAVTGTLALMIERYRQLNSGQNPKSGLLKAIACNTADDLGNRHPDYIHGFGMINARRAIEAINDGLYDSDEIEEGEEKHFVVSTIDGDQQLKVLLYWNDPPAAPTAYHTLINNLDLQVITPSNEIIYPWVLNPDPAHVADNANRGIDELNNIEQVTLDLPEPGIYSIIVSGTQVPAGPQEFFLSYDVITPEIVVTHPAGNEVFEKGEEVTIEWDASPLNSEDFIIEYTLNGSLWIPIGTAAPDQRQYTFQLPTSLSTEAQFWIRTGSQAATSETFQILGTSSILSLEDQCSGEVEIFWSGDNDAIEYTLYQFDGNTMSPVEVTTNTSAQVLADMDQKHWFAVEPVYAGNFAGKRSQADSLTVQCLSSGLPLELSDFSGAINGPKNTISWLTTFEENTDYFILERSTDSRNWELADSVKASGWSVALRSYHSDDYFWYTDTYYRLKTIDFDGAVSYSTVIHLDRQLPQHWKNQLRLFPVPAVNKVMVHWDNEDRYTKGDIYVFDNLKRTLITQAVGSGQRAQEIDLSRLLPGIYVVQKGYYVHKMVVTRPY